MQQGRVRCSKDGKVLATYEQVAYAFSRGKSKEFAPWFLKKKQQQKIHVPRRVDIMIHCFDEQFTIVLI